MVLLVLALAFLLASFPARNSDLWLHLAQGRLLARGEHSFTDPPLPPGLPVNHSWLYDLLCYGLYAVLGGTGLVLFKALLVVGLALLLLRLSRAGPGSSLKRLPVFCTALALLAMGTRLLLQPATVSYLFLALALWFLRPRRESGRRGVGESGVEDKTPNTLTPWLPPWPVLVLFAVWANMDSWFVLGLLTVALVWLLSLIHI